MNSYDEEIKPYEELQGQRKVSVTQEKVREKQEKLAALEKSKAIKTSIKKLDVVSNVLFLISFALIVFIILRYLFYVCYSLEQCGTINWFWAMGILSMAMVFIIVVRIEKERIKTALLKLKKVKKQDTSKQQAVYAKTKLAGFINNVGNLISKVTNKTGDLKDAYHDLYLVFKSFLAEFLQTSKAMSTTELVKSIETNEKLNPELKEYSGKLLDELFQVNYSNKFDEEQFLALANAAQKLMTYLISLK